MQHEAVQAVEVNLGVFVSSFLAASIEVIEMVAIVVAVGITRSWRSSLAGAAGGLIVLIVLVAVLGTALRNVPLAVLRFAVGSLLLVFGLQWLRKGVVRVARDGWAVVVLSVAGYLLGREYNVLESLDLPRIPIDEGTLTAGAAIALAAVVILTLLAATGGGKAGERYHRKIDRLGYRD